MNGIGQRADYRASRNPLKGRHSTIRTRRREHYSLEYLSSERRGRLTPRNQRLSRSRKDSERGRCRCSPNLHTVCGVQGKGRSADRPATRPNSGLRSTDSLSRRYALRTGLEGAGSHGTEWVFETADEDMCGARVAFDVQYVTSRNDPSVNRTA
jgi:hypothetical protein